MSVSDRTARVLMEEEELRRALSKLPPRIPPAALTTELRVLASRELVRRRTRSSVPMFCKHLIETARLYTQNLMRPLAIPTAGGFLAALVLFGVLAPGLTVPGAALVAGEDVPTGLYTGASVRSFVPLSVTDQEIDVELTIDGQGRIVDYEIPNSNKLMNTPALRLAIEKNLLFTQFNPATSFGQPMTGKVRLSFRSSRIDVKG